MRSVFFFLRDTDRQEIGRLISTMAVEHSPQSWCTESGIFLGFYDWFELENEAPSIGRITTALGAYPAVQIQVDVSSRVTRNDILPFVEAFLDRYPGVAWDDHSDYCWTLDEIRSDAAPEGWTFFTHLGKALE